MYEFLKKRNFTNIIILDNASTYPPLLDWYAGLPENAVVRLNNNFGAHCLFTSGYLNNLGSYEYLVYTDPDLEFNPRMPDDFLESMRSMMLKYNEVKIGLALKIDDVPESCSRNCYTGTIDHEKQFWVDEIEKDVYRAMVDTTFCLLHRPERHDYRALRIAGDFTARHLPWYRDYSTINDEERYFIENASTQSNYRNGYFTWMAETAKTNAGKTDTDMEIPYLMPHQLEAFNGDHFIEQEFLKLRNAYGIKTVIETGTCFGSTTKFLGANFNKVISIEINEKYLAIARTLIGKSDNIETYCGASENILHQLLGGKNSDTGNMFFFLDAHWESHCPLRDELKIIAQYKVLPVIAIHDFQVPGEPGLHFDSYNGQAFTFEWIKPLLDNIYGEQGYDHYYNTELNSTEIRIGIIYIVPKLKI
jgi:hypothetical protein